MPGRRVGKKTSTRPVFDDIIVSATMLNRRSGEVLDQALERSVTIMRNEQAFALLPREQASQMTSLLRGAQQVLDLLHAIDRVRSGAGSDPADQFDWITAFGPADLQEMADELYAAYAKIRSGEVPADELDAIIHEWQETAWAVRNPSLRTAFRAAPDEVVLTEPAVRE